jgi:hypothetical protein
VVARTPQVCLSGCGVSSGISFRHSTTPRCCVFHDNMLRLTVAMRYDYYGGVTSCLCLTGFLKMTCKIHRPYLCVLTCKPVPPFLVQTCHCEVGPSLDASFQAAVDLEHPRYVLLFCLLFRLLPSTYFLDTLLKTAPFERCKCAAAAPALIEIVNTAVLVRCSQFCVRTHLCPFMTF